jgi:hypothetical protein
LCGETVISNNNKLNIDNDGYHIFVAESITLENDVHVDSGEQLDVIAKDAIYFLPGFSAEAGSNFSAKIDNSIGYCYGGSYLQKQNDNTNKMETTIIKTDDKLIENNNQDVNNEKDINIYPNQMLEDLNVELNNQPSKNYKIIISDEIGNNLMTLYSKEIKTTIDVSKLIAGVYILQIIDEQTNMLIYNSKIIKR